jgi:uncharacterized protein (TIGR02301 family)
MKGRVYWAKTGLRASALAVVLVSAPSQAQFWGAPFQQQQQQPSPWGGGGGGPWGQQQPRQRPVHREEPRVHRRPAPRPVVRQQPPAPARPGGPQDAAKPETPAAAAPAVVEVPDGPPPPYEPQLLRLSEILGALSYLRDICSAHDGDAWRAKMAALLEAEAKSQTRRERLAGAFNRGFRGYEVIYRTCTSNADTVIARYLDEGGRIARDINYRYGGS